MRLLPRCHLHLLLGTGEVSPSLARLCASCWKVRDLAPSSPPFPTQFPTHSPLLSSLLSCWPLAPPCPASEVPTARCWGGWVGEGLPWQSPAPSGGADCLGPSSRAEMIVCCDGGSGQPARSNAPVSGRQACCLHLAGPQGLAWCPRGLACFDTPGYQGPSWASAWSGAPGALHGLGPGG